MARTVGQAAGLPSAARRFRPCKNWRLRWPAMIDVILPVLDEAQAIPGVLAALPDGLSPDRRRQRLARRLGRRWPRGTARGSSPSPARVRRGLLRGAVRGRRRHGCVHGLRRLAGSARAAPPRRASARRGTADLCLGARAPSAGAWPWHARLANRVLAARTAATDRCAADRSRADARRAHRAAARAGAARSRLRLAAGDGAGRRRRGWTIAEQPVA